MSEEHDRIFIRAHFERFPATVKGAFVIRGKDRDPHQVVFKQARVASVGGHWGRPLAMEPAVLDVAPRQDVFVPFELSVADLDPGWYGLEADLEVDGVPGTFPGGKRFSVAWPRATTRRGQVPVGKSAAFGDGKITVDHVECGGDSIKVHIATTPPEAVSIRLFADGARLEILDAEFDDESGRGKVTAYPLLRTHKVLRIEASAGRRKGNNAVFDIPLA